MKERATLLIEQCKVSGGYALIVFAILRAGWAFLEFVSTMDFVLQHFSMILNIANAVWDSQVTTLALVIVGFIWIRFSPRAAKSVPELSAPPQTGGTQQLLSGAVTGPQLTGTSQEDDVANALAHIDMLFRGIIVSVIPRLLYDNSRNDVSLDPALEFRCIIWNTTQFQINISELEEFMTIANTPCRTAPKLAPQSVNPWSESPLDFVQPISVELARSLILSFRNNENILFDPTRLRARLSIVANGTEHLARSQLVCPTQFELDGTGVDADARIIPQIRRLAKNVPVQNV